ncbi:hypothetical protein PCYB_101820 [Plasmodium cynomolgi strain B]|uniref:Uncharacterized protein n=1 Tax=Plasmodium cynomolgi (strain B) TaxID=1120755 RepID=K6VC79_PLACD|nr:hypothetical protein PCYB_101820 [Plasmodium cynomolgi strain B]GAB66832.1 hypothetical protein PCYB_101820 [Plasmodium cynomolgi strain B]
MDLLYSKLLPAKYIMFPLFSSSQNTSRYAGQRTKRTATCAAMSMSIF